MVILIKYCYYGIKILFIFITIFINIVITAINIGTVLISIYVIQQRSIEQGNALQVGGA